MSSLPPSAVMGLHRFDTDDAFLNTEVNENTDDLDTLPPTVCTSSTRPATNLYQGRFIWESDTKRLMMYDLATATWRMISDNTDGAWTSFTPKLWQNMSTTPTELTSKTVTFAKYKVIGKTLWAAADVTYTGAATTTGGVGLDLPIPAKARHCVGFAGLIGASGTTPADQCGMAIPYANDLAKMLIIGYTGGFRDAQQNNVFRYSATYEIN